MTDSPAVDLSPTTEAGLSLLHARAEREDPITFPARPRGPVHFEPLGDSVLVERRKAEEEVKIGSLFVPDQAKEKPLEADVIAVGGGRITETGLVAPMVVKVGDRVLIGKWAGTEIKIDGYEFLILKQDEILGRRT